MKKCSTSLAMRGMQIKTAMRCHFTPIRIVTVRKTVSVREDVKKLVQSHTAGGNVKWYGLILEDSLAVPQKVKHRVTIRPRNSSPRWMP